jgi:hypothetical protein
MSVEEEEEARLVVNNCRRVVRLLYRFEEVGPRPVENAMCCGLGCARVAISAHDSGVFTGAVVGAWGCGWVGGVWRRGASRLSWLAGVDDGGFGAGAIFCTIPT